MMRFKVSIHGRIRALFMLIIMGVASCAAPSVPSTEYEPAPLPSPTPPPSDRIPSSLPTINFTIQVGAFSTTERAARYAIGLQADGLDAYYFIDTDGLYKVRFERFGSKETARRRALALKTDGHIAQFYIVQLSMVGNHINAQVMLRTRIIQTAHRFIGTHYRWGGASMQGGFDCSGLTMTVYRLNGMQLPRNSRYQYRAGTRVSRDALQNGDLVFFATQGKGRISHVGIYAGQGRFIHAPGKGKRIRLTSLSNPYFSSCYIGARRYF